MSLAPNDFWKLLQQSDLVSEQKLESLRSRIAQKQSIAESSLKIARLLVSNEILTEQQARRLLSGKKIRQRHREESKNDSTSAPTSAARIEPQPASAPAANVIARRKSKSLLPLLLAIAIPAVLLVAGGIWLAMQPASKETATSSKPTTRQGEQTEPTIDDNSPYEFVESDEALWARPVPGQPLVAKYAPAGTQTIIRVRLAELLSHPEGRKILRGLGPNIGSMLPGWLDRIGIDEASIGHIDLHLLPQGTTLPQVVVVTKLVSGTTQSTLPSFASKDANGTARLATDAIWFPPNDEQFFVFGPSTIITAIRSAAAGGGQTILRRELEQLRRETHDTDQLTILANPNFLRDEAQGLFPSTRRRLLDGLYDFWSQDAQAVSVGLQLSDIAIAEARMIAREDLAPRHFAGRTRIQLKELPSQTSDMLGRAELDQYWQPLALRFPTMVKFATDQTRVVAEGKQVAVSAALPMEAVHNLVLAAELGFASPLRENDARQLVDRSAWTIDDALAHATSVRFSQKSLELAMTDVAQQIRDELPGLPFEFSIKLVGTDLEPEGITRNQQIRDFDIRDKPLADALTALVMKANPVQTVSKPSEENQKLVWIPSPSTPGEILITTRSAMQTKGLALPVAFQ